MELCAGHPGAGISGNRLPGGNGKISEVFKIGVIAGADWLCTLGVHRVELTGGKWGDLAIRHREGVAGSSDTCSYFVLRDSSF